MVSGGESRWVLYDDWFRYDCQIEPTINEMKIDVKKNIAAHKSSNLGDGSNGYE